MIKYIIFQKLEKLITLLFLIFNKISFFLKFRQISILIRNARWRSRLGYMGKHVNIYPCVIIHNPKKVSIGNNVTIGEFVHIYGWGGVEIGEDTMVASSCIITSQSHSISKTHYRETLVCKPVVIGKNVWIGAGSIVLPGVSIGNNSVVGAGSVVNKNVPEDTVVVGSPAKYLRSVC